MIRNCLQKFTTKFLITTSIAVLLPVLLNAQSEWSFKLIQNTDIFTSSYAHLPGRTETDEKNASVRFSIAVGVARKPSSHEKVFRHELELFMPEISKPVENVKFP